MKNGIRLRIACVLWVLVSSIHAEDSSPFKAPQKPHWRQPIAMVHAGERIYLANQKSASVTILTVDPLEVFAEIPVGQKLADLAVLQNGRLLAAVDEKAHQLLLLEPSEKGIQIRQRLAVAKNPVGISVDETGERGAVSSLWSRRVTLFRLEETRLKTEAVVDLPFAPEKCSG